MLLRVLGPLGLDEADLGGSRQRAVLARLVVARGSVVSVDRLIEDVWSGGAPPRAIASLRAYVSNLRRVLEPGRPSRMRTELLVSAAPGYALRLPSSVVDAWRFEQAFTAARSVAGTDPDQARQLLVSGLGLWRGAAFAEFSDELWARPEVIRLEDLRWAARELRVTVSLRTGEAVEAVGEAEALTREAPLREEPWRLLALALWHTGRQADALAALRRARTMLAEELGLDPGAALVALESAILTRRPDDLPAPPQEPPAGEQHVAAVRQEAEPSVDREAEPFVGREAELATLAGTARDAARYGVRFSLVTGDAGAGKTTLLTHLRRDLETRGWVVAAGRCPEVEGAPPALAWVEVLRELAAAESPGSLAAELAPLLADTSRDGVARDGTDGRFRLHQAVVEWLAAASARRPVAILLDDLHAGDTETLRLLNAMSEIDATVLFVLAFRPTEQSPRLAASLAALARRSPTRVHLDGLSVEDVQRLVGAFTRTPVDAETLATLAGRTGGNPLFVRELARLLASEGIPVAISEVPEGVRDVLRARLARLPEEAVAVLRLAAVAGREAQVETLVRAADADEGTVLDALETGLGAGLLTEPRPGWVQFVHGLVHDTFYTDVPLLRRARMHARIAERLRPDDHPALARHYRAAASSDTASLAVEHAVRAAELAERRYAYDAAIRLLTDALDAVDMVPGDRDALRVDVLGRLLRAQVRAGTLSAARESLVRAVDTAVESGRDDLLIAALATWRVPTPCLTRAYRFVDDRIVDLLTMLVRRNDLAPADRFLLNAVLAAELEGEPDPRGVEAGIQALALSVTITDPEWKALGQTARLRTMSHHREARERAELATSLRLLAEEHGLVAYRWYAEQVIGHSAAVLGEPAEMRASIARQGTIADTYKLAEPQAINLASQGALAHIRGDFAAAKRFYDDCSAQMRRVGSIGADSIHFAGTSSVLLSQGGLASHLEATRLARESHGPMFDDLLALVLVHAGRTDEARTVPIGTHPCPPEDIFQTGLLAIRARALVALGRKDLAQPVIDVLLPVRNQLAGLSGATIVIEPVALTLGRLFQLQGRSSEADEHFAMAASMARRWESPHWLAEALRRGSAKRTWAA
ncbi:BTAD domain-containing putative transcriptional regulator [Streptosporangium sp. 'caverna']|uniref:BTAD domain-containing putative transcriptional regulator n=1 Tax=Streptosporangium sp. 'caverna' TaxID=2202249 RepID=UPI00195505D2|nr:BTAD domain-containing putative transcriptional regulator [Streptosporangium sp. 'caverna']